MAVKATCLSVSAPGSGPGLTSAHSNKNLALIHTTEEEGGENDDEEDVNFLEILEDVEHYLEKDMRENLKSLSPRVPN